MSEEKKDYDRIKHIFSLVEGVNIRRIKGKVFKFPIYLTDSFASAPIEILDLSTRSNNCLRRVKINTIGDLCTNYTNLGDLRVIRGCGASSIMEIVDNLFYYQYSLLNPEEQKKYLADVIDRNC